MVTLELFRLSVRKLMYKFETAEIAQHTKVEVGLKDITLCVISQLSNQTCVILIRCHKAVLTTNYSYNTGLATDCTWPPSYNKTFSGDDQSPKEMPLQ